MPRLGAAPGALPKAITCRFAISIRALGNAPMIAEAEALLRRASLLGKPGRYQLEAAVQSAHAARRFTGRTDWPAIERLYDALAMLTGSPVVAINRAVAIAEARGPDAGLAALDAIAGDPRLAQYQPYWAACAELLARASERAAAQLAYQRAIGLERDPAVRRFLQRRQNEMRASVLDDSDAISVALSGR